MEGVVDRIAEIPGIDARLEHDPPNHRIPHAVVYFTDDWRGPDRMEIQRRLLAGSPRVYIQIIGSSGELYVDPMNLEEGSTRSLRSGSARCSWRPPPDLSRGGFQEHVS